MADATVDLGTGATITFSGFSAELTSITPSGAARETFESTHLGTTVAGANEFGGRTFVFGTLSDPGEVSVEGHFNPGYTPQLDAAEASLVITFASGTTWTCSAAGLTSYDPSVEVEQIMTFSATFKLSGVVSVSAAA